LGGITLSLANPHLLDALLWLIIAILLIVTLVGAPVGLGVLTVVTLWLIYRIARGWLRLLDKQPMYV
jgi:uncharacterized membrane protein